MNTKNKKFEMPGMQVNTEILSSGKLKISGWAKTQGWIAVGFNTHSGILGADLKMLAITPEGPILDDRKTMASGNYPSDATNGGQMNIHLIDLTYQDGKTHFSFSIPMHSDDPLDHVLTNSNALWIILAYSSETDFEHHSRIRRHFKFN